ncbi:hypothetical protein [Flavimarina sp. Hel_I_48]|nr:hypothetical protein [Flavimarina sp. Hel_I_48]
METNLALGIAVALQDPTGRKPFWETRAKDCNIKPNPQGNVQKQLKI